ncbi:MAG: hypothetical protein L6R42_006210 [Xanthoria sp. 1 TBL-2021]|nr:MAG: hypothetical protein L6R42_006210 [Xanthoria sp. 1 TBL-2021]
MVAFLDLPRETRDAIYEYCLLVEGEIVPYPTEYAYHPYKSDKPAEQQKSCMDRKPDVALLPVSKQIREETCPILYGRNLWRVSDTYRHPGTFRNLRQVVRHSKHIIISLDFRDLDPAYHDDENEADLNRSYVFGRCVGDADHMYELSSARRRNIHDRRVSKLVESWANKMCSVHSIWFDPETVTIDISNCWCPFGCCRLFSHEDCDYVYDMDSYLTITGIQDKKEAGLIQKGYWSRGVPEWFWKDDEEGKRDYLERLKKKLTILKKEKNGSYTLTDAPKIYLLGLAKF